MAHEMEHEMAHEMALIELLKKYNEIHLSVDMYGVTMPIEKLQSYNNEILGSIRSLQVAIRSMVNISNFINNQIKYKTSLVGINDFKYIETYPSNDDIFTLMNSAAATTAPVATAAAPAAPASPAASLTHVEVESIGDIPINKLYYIKPLKQYAINIAGVLVRGNIGTIKNKNDKNIKCLMGKNCNRIKKCTFYHPPEDYIANNIKDFVDERNFTPSSWLYGTNKRQVGDKNNLLDDLYKSNIDREVELREGQLVHDILIYLILCGSSKRYKKWR